MNRSDRKAWASARTLADVGELTAQWLEGKVRSQPGYQANCGPDPETSELIPVLAACNRAGFVTVNSQPADGRREAWVSGFATEAALTQLRRIVRGVPLAVAQCCRGRVHSDCRGWRGWRWGCPWRDSADALADACPAAANEVRRCWYVVIVDPEPGRNDRLWPALAEFAGVVRSL